MSHQKTEEPETVNSHDRTFTGKSNGIMGCRTSCVPFSKRPERPVSNLKRPVSNLSAVELTAKRLLIYRLQYKREGVLCSIACIVEV